MIITCSPLFCVYYDALHVSCAIEGKADYFVTTDIRLLKYSSDEVNIINPIDLITILEG